jgi:starvation-inducible DNA-binding protein
MQFIHQQARLDEQKEFDMPTAKLSTSRLNVPLDARSEMIELLNQRLTDMFDLYSQTKQMHRQVKGVQIYHLHEAFDKLAEKLENFIDLITERVTALGGTAEGRTHIASSASRLPESSPEASDSSLCVQKLTTRYASLAAATRAAIDMATQTGDLATADLLRQISRELDKALWYLKGI